MSQRPAIRVEAEIPGGMTFLGCGRLLRVVRAYGTDAAAPVIVEELMAVGDAMPGQLGLWCVDGVRREMVA